MDNNIDILDELNKGCCMGIDALDFIIGKIDEPKFKELLESQLNHYHSLSDKINLLHKEYTDTNIHETNLMTKAMTWYGIEKDTMMDKSVYKEADLLINGTNMGIIEGQKILNNKTMDKKVHKICKEYVKMQQNYVDKLKEFL